MGTKYKPILFSTEMVQANLEGRKKLTRRTQGLEVINKNPNDWFLDGLIILGRFIFHNLKSKEEIQIKPKFEIGDILWVRETFFDCSSFKEYPLFSEIKGNFCYKTNDFIGCHKWKPSIHMPKKAARIFLEVTNVRVERLQEISEEDAISEGTPIFEIDKLTKKPMYKSINNTGRYLSDLAREGFKILWKKINGEDSWKSNPWVWVYEFKVVEKPKDFINE